MQSLSNHKVLCYHFLPKVGKSQSSQSSSRWEWRVGPGERLQRGVQHPLRKPRLEGELPSVHPTPACHVRRRSRLLGFWNQILRTSSRHQSCRAPPAWGWGREGRLLAAPGSTAGSAGRKIRKWCLILVHPAGPLLVQRDKMQAIPHL